LTLSASGGVILCWLLIGTHAAFSLFAAKPSIHPDGSGSLAAADFNGDGIADLALANPASNTVMIYFATADGSFSKNPARAVATGASIPKEPVARRQAVVAADVNGDGKADLIVTNGTAAVVSILLGRGDGSFAPPIVTSTSAVPTGVTTGDFDGDGKMDLAVVSQGANKVSVWLGKGDGNFMPGRDVAVGRAPTSVVDGDFGTSESNPGRDGKLDLAVTATGDGQINVLFGDGTGAFSAPVPLDAPGATAIMAGDLNRDGVVDLATCNTANNFIGINLGYDQPGVGSFGGENQEADFGPGMQPTGLAAIDLNGDGNLDFAVAAQSVDGKTGGIFLLLSHPRPRMRLVYLDPPTFCATGGNPGALVAAALGPLDGRLALAVGDSRVNHISVLWSDGKGGLTNCAAPQQLGDALPATARTAVRHASGAAPAEEPARQTP
jgi:hypothetical protein